DISAKFVQQPPAPAMDKILPPIDIPGHGEMPLSEFLKMSDSLLRNAAELNKETIELQYETTRTLLHSEALLGQFCTGQFELSKKIRLVPAAMEDTDASRIARVLTQMESLLDLSRLPAIDLLVVDSFLNKV